MTNEIKGLLEKIDCKMKECTNEAYIELLKDYITNLQQENERLNKLIREIALNRLDYAIENARLQDYKSRIDKAIEILKIYRGKLINTYVIGYSDIDELLNILQGSDKE